MTAAPFDSPDRRRRHWPRLAIGSQAASLKRQLSSSQDELQSTRGELASSQLASAQHKDEVEELRDRLSTASKQLDETRVEATQLASRVEAAAEAEAVLQLEHNAALEAARVEMAEATERGAQQAAAAAAADAHDDYRARIEDLEARLWRAESMGAAEGAGSSLRADILTRELRASEQAVRTAAADATARVERSARHSINEMQEPLCDRRVTAA